MIVFVALGKAPSYVSQSVAQARAANRSAAILLLMEAPSRGWRHFARAAAIDLCDAAVLARDARLAEFYRRPDPRDRFRRGFWRHATGRFLALRAAMEREGIAEATHLENDVLLYAPLQTLAGWAPFAAPRLATVFESPGRAIPGIVRVGSRSALDRFTDFILSGGVSYTMNDMELFAAFRRADAASVADLPTVPPRPDPYAAATRSLFTGQETAIPMAPGRWLFDGARIGQYLGGIDPRNSTSWLQRRLRWQRGGLGRPNGFINESSLDDASAYRYRLIRHDGLAVPALVDQDVTFPIATLHVHSKKLGRFTSDSLGNTSTAPSTCLLT